MKKTTTLKHKILAFTGLILCGIVAVIFFIIIPSVRYIFTIKSTIEVTESRMEEQYQRIRLLKKSISELETIRAEVAEFDSVTVASGDELTVIRSLEKLAETNNVSQQFKLSATQNANNLSFDFSVSGTYQHLLSYLRGLELFPYYVSIEKMVINKPAKDTTNLVTATFSATIFRK